MDDNEATTEPGLAARITRALDAFMRVFRYLTLLALVVSCALLAVLLMISVIDVARRNTTDSSFHGAIEYISVGMVIVVFLALARSEQLDKHVRTPLLTSRLPGPVAAVLRGIGLLVCAYVMAWLAYASGVRALDSFEIREVAPGVEGVPVWPARLAIPVGSVLLVVELTYRGLVSLVNFRTAKRPDPLETLGEGNVL